MGLAFIFTDFLSATVLELLGLTSLLFRREQWQTCRTSV
jgi:hypothetical protein